jgi:hypothetical protein
VTKILAVFFDQPSPIPGCATRKVLQIRRQQLEKGIAQTQSEGAAVDLFQRDLPGPLARLVKVADQFAYGVMIEDFDIEFKVQAQTARIDIGGADQCVLVIDQQQLAVNKGGRMKIDPRIMFQQFKQIGIGGPGDKGQVVLLRQNESPPAPRAGQRR